ncbi:MAG: hypothetical protein ABJB69_05305 [Spartobacteria bacterium]
MQLPKTTALAATPKSVLGFSALLLIAAAFFGVMNAQKLKGLRMDAAHAVVPQKSSDQGPANEEELKAREAAITSAAAKVSEAQSKASKAEAELAQVQK